MSFETHSAKVWGNVTPQQCIDAVEGVGFGALVNVERGEARNRIDSSTTPLVRRHVEIGRGGGTPILPRSLL